MPVQADSFDVVDSNGEVILSATGRLCCGRPAQWCTPSNTCDGSDGVCNGDLSCASVLSGDAGLFSQNVGTPHNPIFVSPPGEGLSIRHNHGSTWGTYDIVVQYRCVTEPACETSPTPEPEPESPQPVTHLECTSQMLALPNTTLNATHHGLLWTIPECASMWDFGIRVSTVPPNVLDGTCTQEGTQKWVCPTDLATALRARQVEVVLEVVDASNTDLVYHTYVWNIRYSLDAVMVVRGLTADVTGGRTHHGTSQLPTIKVPGRISLLDPETQQQRDSYTLNQMARMTIYPERPFAEVLSLLRVQIADRTLHPVTTPIVHSDEEMGTGLQWEVRFIRPGRTNVTVHALIQTSGNGTRRLLESASGLEVVEMTATFNIEDETEDRSWTFVIAGTVGGVCVVGVVAGVVLRGLHRRKANPTATPIHPRPPPYAPGFNPGEEMVDVVIK